LSVRVLHVIQSLDAKGGGPPMAMGPMAAALARAGVNVEVASRDAGKAASPLTVPVHDLFDDSGIKKWVGSNVHRFDVLQVHGLWNPVNSAAMKAARKAGVPYVIRTCGMLAPYSWRRRWWKKRPYWWVTERWNCRSAAAFHVTTPGERAEVAAWKLPGPIHEIPLGMDDVAFDAPVDADDLRRRCGPVAGHRPIVLFLGRLHPVKGISDLLLPAFAKLKSDAVLAIVGGPSDNAPNYANEIAATVETLKLGNRVAMLGEISAKLKWNLFDGAALYVQPSHTENFGLAVAEAMARGCPVIVTEGVQSRSVVEAAGGGWVVPFDPDRLAATIDSALTDSAGSAARGRAAREAVRRELSWDRSAERLAAVYQNLLRPAGPARR
jgi:glycosyltransferase involved in cell wall biosynthesis